MRCTVQWEVWWYFWEMRWPCGRCVIPMGVEVHAWFSLVRWSIGRCTGAWCSTLIWGVTVYWSRGGVVVRNVVVWKEVWWSNGRRDGLVWEMLLFIGMYGGGLMVSISIPASWSPTPGSNLSPAWLPYSEVWEPLYRLFCEYCTNKVIHTRPWRDNTI